MSGNVKNEYMIEIQVYLFIHLSVYLSTLSLHHFSPRAPRQSAFAVREELWITSKLWNTLLGCQHQGSEDFAPTQEPWSELLIRGLHRDHIGSLLNGYTRLGYTRLYTRSVDDGSHRYPYAQQPRPCFRRFLSVSVFV